MATETENVAEEIQNEEIVQPPKEEVEEGQQNLQESSEEVKDKEYNFQKLREKSRQVEEERDYYKKQIEEIVRASQSREEPQEETSTVGDEDLIEGRQYKALETQVRELKKHITQKELETIPERLKSRFSDFDDVVTKENIEKLKTTEPELYQSITSGNDLFAKGISAYKTLKGLGLYKSPQNFDKEKEVVKSNHSKPMSVQAVKGQGALHEANVFAQGLTPDLKKQLQKEMEDARKAL